MRLLVLLFDGLLVLIIIGLAFLTITKSAGLGAFAAYVELTLGSDKRLHFIAGFVLTLFAFRLFQRVLYFEFTKSLCLSFVVAIIGLLTDEFSQLLIPSRIFSLEDLGAGLFGIISMLIILVFYKFAFSSKTLFTKRGE